MDQIDELINQESNHCSHCNVSSPVGEYNSQYSYCGLDTIDVFLFTLINTFFSIKYTKRFLHNVDKWKEKRVLLKFNSSGCTSSLMVKGHIT